MWEYLKSDVSIKHLVILLVFIALATGVTKLPNLAKSSSEVIRAFKCQ